MDKKKIGIVLAPLLAVFVYIVPMDLNQNAHLFFSIMVFTLTFWLTEVLPLGITALLGVAIAVVFGIANIKTAFSSLGHPVLLLFIGSFLIAQAMTKHGLDKRFALNFLSLPFFLKSPIRIIAGFSLVSFVLSMWISNTATTAMLLPLSLGIITMFKQNHIKNIKTFAIFILLSIAYSASIGGVSTLIGTPTNLIGVGFLRDEGYDIDFVKWMLIAMPISLTMYIALLLYIKFHLKGFSFDKEKIKKLIHAEKNKLKKMSIGEKNTIVAFSLAVFFWLLPGIANILGNEQLYKFLKAHIPESIVALIAGILLFLLPVDFKKFKGTLEVDDIRKIDWDTVLLFGGGIALGKLIIQTGLAKYIGEKVAHLISPEHFIFFLISLIVAMIFLTEVSSNTATVITFVPILIGVLKELQVDIFYPIVAVVIAASFAFMLPIATPPNAIIYGSKMISINKMVKVGFFLNLIGTAVITIWILIYMR